ILGRTRKAITSRGTTERIHEPRLRKAFQQLADRGCLKMGFRAHLHRGQHLARMARKAGHHHGGVIGKAADTKHGVRWASNRYQYGTDYDARPQERLVTRASRAR